RLRVALRGSEIDLELCCALDEIFLLATLTHTVPRAEYDQNGNERDRSDRSPNRNVPHRRMQRCARLYLSILCIFDVRTVALTFVSFSLDHWAPPSAASPCSWRANCSSSSQVNSFFRSKL